MSNPKWSENTTQYFMDWMEVFHHNDCKNGICTCHARAYASALNRLETIEQGMPDLPLLEERAIWSIAFDIHENYCDMKDTPNWCSGIITPPWCMGQPHCNCFPLARVKYYDSKLVDMIGTEMHVPLEIEVSELDPIFGEERYV